MKTKEELNALKEEVETLNRKLHELTEDELRQVIGGVVLPGHHQAYHLPVIVPDYTTDFDSK